MNIQKLWGYWPSSKDSGVRSTLFIELFGFFRSFRFVSVSLISGEDKYERQFLTFGK